MPERAVEELYRRARAAPGEVLWPSSLARRLPEIRGVVRVKGLHVLGRLVNGELIEVQDGLLAPIEEWIVGHELGHFIRGSNHGDPREEIICDYIGAAIQMRKRVFVKRAKEVGGDLRQLAIDFGVTQTSAAMRLGETRGQAIAVVTRSRVYARGELQKTHEGQLREWARYGHPSIRRALLEDDPSRTLLIQSG